MMALGKVQNKMHYAVHGHTAAELIYERADADKPHMGLTTWAAAPKGKIVKSDVSVAKNYLSEQEMRSLERIVSAYLDLAEDPMENYADADKLYQEYLGKHPNDAFIYNQYGAYLINRGKYANALVYIETGIELGDSDAMQGLMYNQAVCYEYKHDYDKARDAFEEYLKSYPNDKAARKEYDFLMTR